MNKPKRTRVEPRNIAMYPGDWVIVTRVSQRLGLDNTSAAIRYIIRDWHRRTPDISKRPIPTSTTTLEPTL